MNARASRLVVLLGLVALLGAACADDRQPAAGGSPAGEAESITVYSGREKDLVEPAFEQFEKATGITVEARYGDSAELAAQILEEGGNSPADVFFAQDAGALGAVAEKGVLAKLDEGLMDRVADKFRADDATWVGVTGRARTVVYNTEKVSKGDLPGSILGFADPRWKDKIGWAPTNASFQAFVTALRVLKGEDAARDWLTKIKQNGAKIYPKNTPIVEAVGAGEIEIGFVNHYYLLKIKKENQTIAAENHFFKDGDPAALVNVAGVGIVQTSKKREVAERFVDYLLDEEAQRYFATKTFEYPLNTAVSADARLPKIDTLQPPDLDLSKLSDLQATLDLLKDVGLL